MNINSNELLLINKKNLKFGETPGAQEPALTAVDSPVTNPEETIKALDFQGLNNIAFQGVNLNKASQVGLKAMAALTLLAGAASLQSCESTPEVSIKTEVSVSIDFEAVTAAINEMKAILGNMAQSLLDLLAEVQKGNATEEAFYQAFCKAVIQNEVMQQQILEAIINNGKSQAEANEIMSEIRELIEKQDYAAAFEIIQKYLGSIDETLKEMKVILEGLAVAVDTLVQQGEMDKDFAQEIKDTITNFYNAYINNEISKEDFYKKVANYMQQDSVMQQLILKQLIRNGKTEEEAAETLKNIEQMMASGKYEEAVKTIIELLKSANDKLDTLIQLAQKISEQINKNHEELMAAKEEEIELLSGIYINSELELSELDKLNNTSEKMLEKVTNLETASNELLTYVNANHAELIDAIKNKKLSDEEYQKFEEMFKLMNMNMTDVINMTKDEIVNAIKNFQDTYINVEKQHAEKFTEINNKLDILVNFPGLDSEKIEDAIKDLIDANNQNAADLSTQLDAILEQLKILETKLNALFNQIGDLSEDLSLRHQMYMEKWNATLDKLDDFKGDLTELKTGQALSNTYLAALLTKGNEIILKLEEMDVAAGGGMTAEEFEEIMKKRDEEAFKQYTNFIVSLGLDNLIKDTATIKEIVSLIKDTLAEKESYSKQLDTIISLLDKLDKADPNYTTQLDEIIKLLKDFKCNCECGNGAGSNEGILDDIENILGGNTTAEVKAPSLKEWLEFMA